MTTAAMPISARTFATRLVEQDKVDAIVGGSTTGATLAMIPVFEDAEMPLISLAGAVLIIQPVKNGCSRRRTPTRMACEKIFADMKHRNLTKMALISGTGGFGKSMRAECLKVAGKAGIKIVIDETYGPRDSDMTPQLTKIRDTPGVQAVLNAGFGQGPAIVTHNYRQLGITVPLYESHGVCLQAVHQARRRRGRGRAPALRGAADRRQAAHERSAEAGRRRLGTTTRKRPGRRSRPSAATPMTG